MEDTILNRAIESVQKGRLSFCKYITPNETGSNGSHQCGFYINKEFAPRLFDTPPQRGANAKRDITINWQDDVKTQSVLTYYGQKTRNEYRVTCFGRGFYYLNEAFEGSLLVFSHMEGDCFNAYILTADEDIETFFATFNLSPTDTNKLIDSAESSPNKTLEAILAEKVRQFDAFPSTEEMAEIARKAFMNAFRKSAADVLKNPDKMLTDWYDTEYQFFRTLEDHIYAPELTVPFYTTQKLIDFANPVINRRKSRAGRSLEHHLAKIFEFEGIKYEAQPYTEGKKQPDFIFPDGTAYHDFTFPADGLTFLGAKTTCKDRWRQVLTEADRIDHKHLFTLQEGISRNQLQEMTAEQLTLVVPQASISTFPKEFQPQILSLHTFVEMVREKQSIKQYAL